MSIYRRAFTLCDISYVYVILWSYSLILCCSGGLRLSVCESLLRVYVPLSHLLCSGCEYGLWITHA